MRFGVADLINRRNAQLTAAIAERGQQYAADQVDGHRGKGGRRRRSADAGFLPGRGDRPVGARPGAAGQRDRRRAAKRGDHPGGPRLLQRRRPGPAPVDRLLRVCDPAHKHPQQLLQFLVQFQGRAGVCGPRVPNHGRAGRTAGQGPGCGGARGEYFAAGRVLLLRGETPVYRP